MSNQRPGKYEKRLDVGPNMTPMAFIKCITQCAKVLDANGHEDPAFYFEQLADYIKSGKVRGYSIEGLFSQFMMSKTICRKDGECSCGMTQRPDGLCDASHLKIKK